MSRALQLVLEQRQQAEDDALKRLAEARQAYAALEHKANTMASYRDEYLQQMSSRAQGGVMAQSLGHYQAFIARLDAGQQELQQSLAGYRAAMEDRERQWRQSHQEKRAIELLLERQHQRQVQQQARQDQKIADEFSQRRFAVELE
ncbi:flagellar export protein FliJ [Gallaecimonas sp. GXIMD4217]|uniref:flagellar export protein FliJ n=1 Tax=Gallaecimonas sp. GXIMD4217 TaxID=3131927 RepID=UPI00311B1EDA